MSCFVWISTAYEIVSPVVQICPVLDHTNLRIPFVTLEPSPGAMSMPPLILLSEPWVALVLPLRFQRISFALLAAVEKNRLIAGNTGVSHGVGSPGIYGASMQILGTINLSCPDSKLISHLGHDIRIERSTSA